MKKGIAPRCDPQPDSTCRAGSERVADSITISRKQGYLWITLPGMLAPDSYTTVQEEIEEEIDNKPDRVVLDLECMDTIYSSALSLMIRLRKRVAELGGYLCLVNVSTRCRQFLNSVQLHRVFRSYGTEQEFFASGDEVWKQRLAGAEIGFVMVKQIEEQIMRITAAGRMTALQDLSPLYEPVFVETVQKYLFDFSGLDLLDSAGASLLARTCVAIQNKGGRCIAYGLNELVEDQFRILSLDKTLPCRSSEEDALTALKETLV